MSSSGGLWGWLLITWWMWLHCQKPECSISCSKYKKSSAGWLKSQCAADDYNIIIRCAETLWSSCIWTWWMLLKRFLTKKIVLTTRVCACVALSPPPIYLTLYYEIIAPGLLPKGWAREWWKHQKFVFRTVSISQKKVGLELWFDDESKL